MTVEAYPGLLQNKTYPAEIVRRMFNSFLQRGSTIGSGVGGLVVATDCQIQTASSGVKVLVEPGELWVPGSYSGSTTQGSYYTRVSATETLTCSAAESNPRVERVVVRVKDQTYSGSENEGLIELHKGTANASANINTLAACETYGGTAPENSYTLGYVLVPNTTTLAGQGGVLTAADIKNTSSAFAFSPRALPASVGAWETVAYAAKTEGSSSPPQIKYRVEGSGNVVRLKGALKVKSGQFLKSGNGLFTAAVGWRPAETVYFTATALPSGNPKPILCSMGTEGSAGLSSLEEVPEGTVVYFDGCTYTLT